MEEHVVEQLSTFEDTIDSFSEHWDTLSKHELSKQEVIVLLVYMRWLDSQYKFPPQQKAKQ